MGLVLLVAVAKRLGRAFIGIEQDAKYALEAEKRISKVEKIDTNDLIQTPRKIAEPRIPFGHLLEQGLINPGELLQDSRSRWTAKIRADGSLISEDKKDQSTQLELIFKDYRPATDGHFGI